MCWSKHNAGKAPRIMVLNCSWAREGTESQDNTGVLVCQPDSTIIYATQPGKYPYASSGANDTNGRNSAFTKAFLDNLRPGIELKELFNLVQESVSTSTGKRQTPELLNKIEKKSYFNRKGKLRKSLL